MGVAGALRALLRWVRRRPDVPLGAVPLSHASAVVVLMWALVVCGAVETVVVHLLIPWQGMRLAIDVLSVLVLAWLLSYAVTPSVRPHLLTSDALVLRAGTRDEVPVPRQQVGAAAARERTHDSRSSVSVEGDVLSVAVARRTNVDVQLSSPMVVDGVEVRCVRFFCDEPKSAVAQLATG